MRGGGESYRSTETGHLETIAGPRGGTPRGPAERYLTSTEAPAASRVSLALSAASLVTFSRTV